MEFVVLALGGSRRPVIGKALSSSGVSGGKFQTTSKVFTKE